MVRLDLSSCCPIAPPALGPWTPLPSAPPSQEARLLLSPTGVWSGTLCVAPPGLTLQTALEWNASRVTRMSPVPAPAGGAGGGLGGRCAQGLAPGPAREWTVLLSPHSDTWTHTHTLSRWAKALSSFLAPWGPPPSIPGPGPRWGSQPRGRGVGLGPPPPWGAVHGTALEGSRWRHPWRGVLGAGQSRTPRHESAPKHGRPRQSSHVYLENGVR